MVCLGEHKEQIMTNVNNHEITFAPLVQACKAHGISRTTAWILCKEGLLENFNIGTRKYVYLESLRTLPQRLAERGRNK